MRRFFCEEIDGELAYLRGEECQHLRRVLRLTPGEEVEIIAREGMFSAVLEDVGEKQAVARVLSELPGREAACRITLYHCLPKSDRMEYILQKGVEIGVAAFAPVISQRCVARVGEEAGRKLERWQRIVREAVKQSGRTAVPEVLPPMPWAQAVARAHALKLVPWEELAGGEATCSFRGALGDVPNDIGVYIGPEGGLTAEEIALATQHGAVAVSLGPRILRADTAGLAVVSAILFASGDMGG